MQSISVDTATQALSLALAEGRDEWHVKQTLLLADSRQHGETLVDQVAQILHKENWQSDMINQVIVGIGPGSYTGLRIGLTLAKVWATAKNLPLFAISSLALMVPPPQNEQSLYVPLIDARRGTVYTGGYRLQDDQLQAVIADQQVDWEKMIKQLNQVIEASKATATPITDLVCLGTAIDDFMEILSQSELAKTISVTHLTNRPRAEHAYAASHQSLLDRVADPDLLSPNYIHKTLAEREWETSLADNEKKEEQSDDYIDHYSAMVQSIQFKD